MKKKRLISLLTAVAMSLTMMTTMPYTINANDERIYMKEGLLLVNNGDLYPFYQYDKETNSFQLFWFDKDNPVSAYDVESDSFIRVPNNAVMFTEEYVNKRYIQKMAGHENMFKNVWLKNQYVYRSNCEATELETQV